MVCQQCLGLVGTNEVVKCKICKKDIVEFHEHKNCMHEHMVNAHKEYLLDEFLDMGSPGISPRAREAEAEAARASATQWEPLFPWGLSHEELAPLLAHFALAGHSADVARTCTARAVAGQAGRKAW